MVEAMRLRAVLRDPLLMALHPEPAALTQLRLCEEYVPHVSAQVFNYARVASAECSPVGPEESCAGDLDCLRAVRPGVQLSNCTKEGHICTADLSFLKWPYLQQLCRLGRKFRLPMSLQEVQRCLDDDLQSYVDRFTRKRPHLSDALQRWTSAVKRQAMENARRSFRRWSPEGCDGFRQQLKEAHELLVFGPEDRGPHLMHAACKKWYLRQLRNML